jgi:hypothetical protein
MDIAMQHKPCPSFPLITNLSTGKRESLQEGKKMKNWQLSTLTTWLIIATPILGLPLDTIAAQPTQQGTAVTRHKARLR